MPCLPSTQTPSSCLPGGGLWDGQVLTDQSELPGSLQPSGLNLPWPQLTLPVDRVPFSLKPAPGGCDFLRSPLGNPVNAHGLATQPHTLLVPRLLLSLGGLGSAPHGAKGSPNITCTSHRGWMSSVCKAPSKPTRNNQQSERKMGNWYEWTVFRKGKSSYFYIYEKMLNFFPLIKEIPVSDY